MYYNNLLEFMCNIFSKHTGKKRMSEKVKQEAEGLEQFFKDTLVKAVKYLQVAGLIANELDLRVLDKYPTSFIMSHVADYEGKLLSKEEKENEGDVRDTVIDLFYIVFRDTNLVGENAHFVEIIHSQPQSVTFKIYRYFECCVRIAVSHKKILTRYIESSV